MRCKLSVARLGRRKWIGKTGRGAFLAGMEPLPPPPAPPVEPVPAPPVLPERQTDETDRMLIILCHAASLLGVGLVLPLIVYLIKKDGNEEVRAHALEVLNFDLSLLIYCAVSGVAVFACYIGVPFLFAFMILSLVCHILGRVKATEGVRYRYPLNLRLVR